jgi:transcriptional regulator with XRE-family HTH domain
VKLRSFREYLKEQLKDPHFAALYEKEKRKLFIGYQIFLAREKAGMTQAELARRIGTRQSNISRLEFGNYNFTVEMLQKIAKALHVKLRIDFLTEDLDKAA